MSRLHGRPGDQVLASGGIVRGARRPEGWRVPGPQIPFPPEDETLLPRAGEDLCFLAGQLRILQRLDGHRWSLDDLVTAWMGTECLPPAQVRSTLDLGCGIGTVLLLTAWRFPEARCTGIEAQEVSVALASRSIRLNGLEPRIELIHGDLRTLEQSLPGQRFSLVTGTPPYIPPGAGVESSRIQCGPCRFETRGGIEAYCLAASSVLEPEGRFAVCEGAGQEERVISAARAAELIIQETLEVIPKEGKGALLRVYLMKKCGAQPGNVSLPPLGVERSLVVRDRQDRWTPAFRAVREAMGMPGSQVGNPTIPPSPAVHPLEQSCQNPG